MMDFLIVPRSPEIYDNSIRINGIQESRNYEFTTFFRVSEYKFEYLKTNLERVKKELGYD